MNEWRIGSLFSGIGGLEAGLEWAGLGRTAWQVEFNEYAAGVLEAHWPEANRFQDVREVGVKDLGRVDVMCGGFPCQDISNANQDAKGLEGARSGLWFEFARLIGEVRPNIVIVENVAALLRRGIDQVLGELAKMGYDAEWGCISAASVGAPHLRERIFIVAYPHGFGQLDGGPGIFSTENQLETLAVLGGGGATLADSDGFGRVARRPNQRDSSGRLSLTAQAHKWPTPTAHNSKEFGSPAEYRRNTPTLNAQAAEADRATGQLNPLWVEWLMGFPTGWTGFDALGTPLFPKSLNTLEVLS